MLKISRLTDYGLLATIYLARKRGEVVSAREIAEFYHLPVPTVTKVLKTLQQGGIVRSHRGVAGGYSFDGDAETLTLGQMLELLEGPWDLVECESTDDRGIEKQIERFGSQYTESRKRQPRDLAATRL